MGSSTRCHFLSKCSPPPSPLSFFVRASFISPRIPGEVQRGRQIERWSRVRRPFLRLLYDISFLLFVLSLFFDWKPFPLLAASWHQLLGAFSQPPLPPVFRNISLVPVYLFFSSRLNLFLAFITWFLSPFNQVYVSISCWRALEDSSPGSGVCFFVVSVLIFVLFLLSKVLLYFSLTTVSSALYWWSGKSTNRELTSFSPDIGASPTAMWGTPLEMKL